MKGKFQDSFGARGQPKGVATDIKGKGIAKIKAPNDNNLRFGLYNNKYIEVTNQRTKQTIYITQANAMKLAYWILDTCHPHGKQGLS